MKIFHILTAALIFRIAISFLAWHPDLNNHVDWGIRFWEYGPADFYSQNVWNSTWPNQPPGTIYTFAAVRKLYEAVFGTFWFLNTSLPIFPSNIIPFFVDNLYPALLKLPAILADLGIAYLIYVFFKDEGKRKIGLAGAGLFLANPVIWYNSSVWGQTDALINFLSLAAFILLLKKKVVLATTLIALSVFTKASLLIFLPIFLIVLIRQRYKVSELIRAFIIPVLIVGSLTLPFSAGEPFSWLSNLYQGKIFKEQLHLITANAFNIWATVATIHERQNIILLGPLPYALWGEILFAISFLPMAYLVYRRQDKMSIFTALTLTAFGSFMLLTNMHERYLYPLFPVFTILAILNRKLLPVYLGLSFINFLNLYNFWWVPRNEVLIEILSFQDRVLPRILGLVSFALFAYCYIKSVKNFTANPRNANN